MYTHMLMLGGYCSVFEDVAALYLKVHEKFIRPGIDLVRELSLEDDSSDKSARGKKLQALHEYSTNHQQEIVKILKDVCLFFFYLSPSFFLLPFPYPGCRNGFLYERS